MFTVTRGRSGVPMGRRSILGGAVLAIGLTLAGSGLLATRHAYADEKPLVIARDMDLNSIDPSRAYCDTCQIYISAVYQTLVTMAVDNHSIAPLLAESWDINTDATEYTIHINSKAVFSDGSPVEAKDVKWSFERLKNMQSGGAYMMDGIKSIVAKDAKTVVITMEASNSEFIGILASPNTAIINSVVAIKNGALADENATKDTAEPWFLANSAGSGPYVLDSYKPNDELRLKRNDKYWGNPAPIGAVVLRQVKEAVAQAQMLQSGAVDIAMQIDPDTAKTVTGDNVVLETVPSFNYLYFAMCPGAKGNKVPLTPDVRQAIAYAVDYQGMVDFTVGGKGKLQASPIPNGFPGSEGLPDPKYDLAKAQELLAKAGLADGFEIDAKFPALTVYGVDMSLLMQKLQQDLAKVKIKLNLTPLTFPLWREAINGDGIPLTAVFFAPDYFGSSQYAQYFGMIEGTSWSKRAGAKVDPSILNAKEAELHKQALAATGDKMVELYKQVGQEMINDRIIVPLVSPNLVLAHAKDVKGMRYSACCNLPLAEISR